MPHVPYVVQNKPEKLPLSNFRLFSLLTPPKRRYRGLPFLADAFGAEDFFYRKEKDFQVEKKGAMIDVIDV